MNDVSIGSGGRQLQASASAARDAPPFDDTDEELLFAEAVAEKAAQEARVAENFERFKAQRAAKAVHTAVQQFIAELDASEARRRAIATLEAEIKERSPALERIIAFYNEELRPKHMEQQEPPSEHEPTTPDALLGRLQTLLGEMAIVAAEADRLQAEAEDIVSRARQQGVTWGQIGEVTGGVTPQSAYQRWSNKGRQKHREYQRKRR